MVVARTKIARSSVVDQRRDDRHAARRFQWAESQLERVRSCGRASVNEGGAVGVKMTPDGRAGFSGVASCGSTWACAWCSAKIAATRQGEITAAAREWTNRGGRIGMITLTMRHDRGQRLRTLWEGQAKAWHAVTSGRAWKDDQLAFGLHGWVRVVETTKGCHGWHNHVHALMFLPGEGDTLLDPSNLADGMFERWGKSLKRQGLKAPLKNRGGLHFKIITNIDEGFDYFTKTVYRKARSAEDVAGLELARADLKRGKIRDCCGKEHRAPFEILADVIATGDADDLDAWHEFERVSKGRRQMTWSKGLRADLVRTAELSDEQIAEQDHGGDLVAVLPAATWAAVRWDQTQLLRSFERSEGFEALAGLGLAWEVPAWSPGAPPAPRARAAA